MLRSFNLDIYGDRLNYFNTNYFFNYSYIIAFSFSK